MLHSCHPFFLNNWFLHVYGNFYWHFNRYLHSFFNLYWPVYIYWFVNIDWFFHYCWHFHCFDDLSGGIFDFYRYFLLNLNIFGYLNNFLNNPFRARNMFGNFYHDLDRLFNNDFLYDFFGHSGG